MTTTGRLRTGEDVARLPHDGRRYKLLDGVLHEMAPNKEVHDEVRTLIALAFGEYVLAHKLGRVMTGETGYCLRRNPDRLRASDLAFKSNETLRTAGLSRMFSEVLPDMVVEIVSPADMAAEVEEKTLEWLAAGVRLVLVVYPTTRSVPAYRGPRDVRHYTHADTLDAEPVLSGFTCPVARLFPQD